MIAFLNAHRNRSDIWLLDVLSKGSAIPADQRIQRSRRSLQMAMLATRQTVWRDEVASAHPDGPARAVPLSSNSPAWSGRCEISNGPPAGLLGDSHDVGRVTATSSRFSAGVPTQLFEGGRWDIRPRWDVTPAGRRFLTDRSEVPPQRTPDILPDFGDELKRRVQPSLQKGSQFCGAAAGFDHETSTGAVVAVIVSPAVSGLQPGRGSEQVWRRRPGRRGSPGLRTASPGSAGHSIARRTRPQPRSVEPVMRICGQVFGIPHRPRSVPARDHRRNPTALAALKIGDIAVVALRRVV